MRCDDAARVLTELLDQEPDGSSDAHRHVERCLRCQAQLAQHRKLARAMGELRDQVEEPDPQLVGDVLATIGVDVEPGSQRAAVHRRRGVYVAAAATAATAAGAAGAWVIALRSRRSGPLSPTG